MTEKEIQNKLQEVFQMIFKQNQLMINTETSARDIKGWDSFMHMELIAAVELAFGVAFSFNEVIKFNTVGDLMRLIEKKLAE